MDLIQELNLEKLTEEDRNKIISQFLESLSKRIMLRVYDGFRDDQKKELEVLANKGDFVSIDNFLNKNVSNIEKIRDEEMDALVTATQKFINA